MSSTSVTVCSRQQKRDQQQATHARRLRLLLTHLSPSPNLDQSSALSVEDTSGSAAGLWDEISVVTRVSLGLIMPVTLYCALCVATSTPPSEHLVFLIDTYANSVGLYALSQMHQSLRRHLGVRYTLTRSYQALSLFGAALNAFSQFGSIHSVSGQAKFVYQILHTSAYAYFLYLTLLYNKELPDPRDTRRIYGVVHWKSLGGFIAVIAATVFVWIREAPLLLSSTTGWMKLALVGFVLSCLGIARGGLKSIMTSVPVISPFGAVMPLACASLLSILTKLPYFVESPITRVYVFGHFSVLYCLIIIAYFCLRESREAEAAREGEGD